jgi:Dynein heavy chain, N-terminal region 2
MCGQGICSTWGALAFRMGQQDNVPCISNLEDALLVLDDSLTQLATIKAERSFHIFADDVEFWEAKLSLVADALEAIGKARDCGTLASLNVTWPLLRPQVDMVHICIDSSSILNFVCMPACLSFCLFLVKPACFSGPWQ